MSVLGMTFGQFATGVAVGLAVGAASVMPMIPLFIERHREISRIRRKLAAPLPQPTENSSRFPGGAGPRPSY